MPQEPPTQSELEELGEIAKLIEVEETAQYGNDVNNLGQRVFRIMDHDLVIFVGDFNYRISEGIGFPVVGIVPKMAPLRTRRYGLHVLNFRIRDEHGDGI